MRKADIVKIVIVVNYFRKGGSEYILGSEYVRVPYISVVLNIPRFSTYQGSEYASGSEQSRILKIYKELQRVLNIPEYTRIIPEYF